MARIKNEKIAAGINCENNNRLAVNLLLQRRNFRVKNIPKGTTKNKDNIEIRNQINAASALWLALRKPSLTCQSPMRRTNVPNIKLVLFLVKKKYTYINIPKLISAGSR